MIGFALGVASTLAVQQAWKYRDVLDTWLAKLQAKYWKP